MDHSGTEYEDCTIEDTCDQIFFNDPMFALTITEASYDPNSPCYGQAFGEGFAPSDACLASLWPGVFSDPTAPTQVAPTCDQILINQIADFLSSSGSPLANYADLFVADAQADGLDPRLLVAIAGAESSFDKAANLATIDDPFGVFMRVGTGKTATYVPRPFSSLQSAILYATNLAAGKGFTSVAQFYSGAPGAWCVNRPGHPGECPAAGGKNATSIISSFAGDPSVGLQPGNPNNLAFPCPPQ